MAQPQVNPSPKKEFQSYDKNVTLHRKLIESPEVSRGIHYALLEMQAMLCERSKDANTAAASHFMMTGAIEFVKVFRTLGEQTTPPPRAPQQGLDHRV